MFLNEFLIILLPTTKTPSKDLMLNYVMKVQKNIKKKVEKPSILQ